MQAWMYRNERMLAEGTRRKPQGRPVLHVAAMGTGDCEPHDGEVPGELHLEATDETGEAADWLEDSWWMEVLNRWHAHPLAIHILPTPRALLHPVVVHHLEMLYRVAPQWRRIGHCYVDDVVEDGDIRRLASSSYDEVRVIDSFRPSTGKSEAQLRDIKVEKFLGRVMRAQSSIGATRPMLIRVPAQAPSTESAPPRARTPGCATAIP